MEGVAPPKLGDRVQVRTEKVKAAGIIRYVGPMELQGSQGSPGGSWVGVELDQPMPPGKGNNGTVQGVTYFTCRPNHGVFVRPSKVKSSSQADWSYRGSTLFPDTGTSPPGHEPACFDDRSNTGDLKKGGRSQSPGAARRNGNQGKIYDEERDTIRRQLVEAAENNDMTRLEAVLPKAATAGVPAPEIEAARRLLQYETMNGDTTLKSLAAEGSANEGADVLQRLARFLARQDVRFAKIEARLKRLENGEEVAATPTTAATDLSDSLTHEALKFGDSASVDRRVAFLEGRLDSLWQSFNGERLEAYDSYRAGGSKSGNRAGEESPSRGGSKKTANADGVISKESLQEIFFQHSNGKGSLPTGKLAKLFSDLGFVVNDPATLCDVLDSQKTGRVSLEDVLAAFDPVGKAK
mmetsp:Transcript_89507/g.186993  ORF Transcript_89507/g.186993 Transcript_89507/m.186993 type:complete len:409 (+) Transcript_89507:111-1337(+)